MKQGVKTVIDLEGIDLDKLTPDNFREVTKAAGKNPGPALDAKGRPHKMAGVPRGYRLRLTQNFAKQTEGTKTNKNCNQPHSMTVEEARWERLREIIAAFRVAQQAKLEKANV